MLQVIKLLFLVVFFSTISVGQVWAVKISQPKPPTAPKAPSAPTSPSAPKEIPTPPESPDPPEAPGVYDVPGFPGMKVRVFAHPEKPLKTATAPALVCNLSDPDSTAVVAAAGWKLPANVTYSLNLGSVPSTVGSANLPAISTNGFGAWSSAVSGKVTFTRGANTSTARSLSDGKNIIAWNRLSSSYLGVTYIRYYPSTGQVVDVDTILNKRYPWTWSNSNTCADPNSYDVQDILTHEQGHWLGLDDEYDTATFENATMYGYGAKGEAKKNTLTTGDVAGVSALY